MFLCCFLFVSEIVLAQKNIYIKFEAIANGKKIVLNDSIYTNNFGENYTVSKLKFYISNLYLLNLKSNSEFNNIYLIDIKNNDSVKCVNYPEDINAISFQLGVDSALNCSGAQSGALDPLNDMFWTWNSGYINFKLEGISSASTADKQRIEQHIGGYKFPYGTQRKIQFMIPYKYFEKNKTITIQIDLDKYWDGENKISIAKTPVIASPGEQAKNAAGNFVKMFSIKK